MMKQNSNSQKRKIFLDVLLVLLVAALVLCGVGLFRRLAEHDSARSAYAALADEVRSDPAQPGAVRDSSGDTDDVEQKEEQGINFDVLLQKNADVVAWISAPEVGIDYPVVQGGDNSYYLRRLLDGSYSIAGTVFVDYRCTPAFGCGNTVLYGHHMDDGTMFSSLVGYKKQSYYDEHPSISLETPTGSYILQPVAGVVAGGNSIIPTSFASGQAKLDYLQKMQAASTFRSTLAVNEQDELVTLVTCTYDFEDARYILIARLVPQE